MNRIKNKYKSLYWQQFLLTASLVLLNQEDLSIRTIVFNGVTV